MVAHFLSEDGRHRIEIDPESDLSDPEEVLVTFYRFATRDGPILYSFYGTWGTRQGFLFTASVPEDLGRPSDPEDLRVLEEASRGHMPKVLTLARQQQPGWKRLAIEAGWISPEECGFDRNRPPAVPSWVGKALDAGWRPVMDPDPGTFIDDGSGETSGRDDEAASRDLMQDFDEDAARCGFDPFQHVVFYTDSGSLMTCLLGHGGGFGFRACDGSPLMRIFAPREQAVGVLTSRAEESKQEDIARMFRDGGALIVSVVLGMEGEPEDISITRMARAPVAAPGAGTPSAPSPSRLLN
jgi:hypothetical protein